MTTPSSSPRARDPRKRFAWRARARAHADEDRVRHQPRAPIARPSPSPSSPPRSSPCLTTLGAHRRVASRSLAVSRVDVDVDASSSVELIARRARFSPPCLRARSPPPSSRGAPRDALSRDVRPSLARARRAATAPRASARASADRRSTAAPSADSAPSVIAPRVARIPIRTSAR